MPESVYAHIRIDDEVPIYQTLWEHSKKTASYAEKALREIGLGATAKLAGLLHDAGKASDAFQHYLFAAIVERENVQRGSVNHTSAGCKFFLDTYHKKESDMQSLTAEILAYACGAHHGLFDCLDEKNGFAARQASGEKIQYEPTMDVFRQVCSEDIEHCIFEATKEIGLVVKTIGEMCINRSDEEADFYFGMLERMILSAVMEGDRRDTAEFMGNEPYSIYGESDNRETIWSTALQYMEEKLSKLDSMTPINRARREISDRCAACGEKPGAVFQLKVPTGAGKTLSSLRYALHHAKKYRKTRIIFTSSLLTVLDQNAQVIREYLPNQSMVLEHHSNVVQPKDYNEQKEWEIMTEAWRSPVVITTLVQLLNTIFLGKTSSIRRFHALCNAVLIIDEVQTVPENLLTLFNLALNFLSEVCHTTIVLCSATQPCLDKVSHPLLYKPMDMLPREEPLWSVFKRTTVQNLEGRPLEEIPALARKILQEKRSLLIVCNLKKQAKALFELCGDMDVSVFHLSAGMCMQHRRDTLKAIQKALNNDEKVLCVSTQVIEAGVDISFESVVRICAGMDSVVQSAGRCNRNGENASLAPVYIVECKGEKLGRMESVDRAKRATTSLLNAFSESPEAFQDDLTSDRAIEFYFETLYDKMDVHYQDGVDLKRNINLYKLLSDNSDGSPYVMQQAFKTAGECFSVFDTDTVEIVVGYGEGRNLRSRLIEQSQYSPHNYKEIGALVQQAKPYTVSIRSYLRERLEKKKAILYLFDGRVAVLSDGFYNENTGFTTDEQFLEV